MQDTTVAIKNVAIYYGIPKYGHKKCLRYLVGRNTEECTQNEPNISQMRCIECGKLLLPQETPQQVMYQQGDRVLKKSIAFGIQEGTVILAFNSFQTREDCLQVRWEASGRMSTTKPDAVLPHTPKNLQMLEAKWNRRHAKQATA